MISVEAHGMEASYIPAMNNMSWASLVRASSPPNPGAVKSWLETAAEGHSGFTMGSAKLLTMIGQPLLWVLAKAGKLVVGVALTAGATLLDQLAWLLGQGAALSREVGGYVRTLFQALIAFLGRTIAAGTDITAAFLRWTLALLFDALVTVAKRAVELRR